MQSLKKRFQNTTKVFYKSHAFYTPILPSNVRVIRHESKLITLEQTRRAWFANIFIFMFNLPKKLTVDLDLMGSRVVELIDGKNNILQISQILSQEDNQTVDSIYQRVIDFLRILKSNFYIHLKRPSYQR
ncbi:MAG: PqqD family protein [Chitinivibrionales bacterium]|nr:PqqD family protein [Chitinivibrionales bacterium]